MRILFLNFFVLFISLVFQGCDQGEKNNLIGEWRNLSIDVTMKTAGGSDSTQVFSANQQNWIQKLGIKPIRTFYKDDGSYISKYFSPNDSLIRKNSGQWEIKDDSLYLYQTSPDSVTYISKFSVQNDTARFEMILDWDQDGVKDDHYIGIQKRYPD